MPEPSRRQQTRDRQDLAIMNLADSIISPMKYRLISELLIAFGQPTGPTTIENRSSRARKKVVTKS